MPPATSIPSCPNCNTPLPRGAHQCPRCQLAVAQWPAFSAAKQAAQRRGIRKTAVERAETAWRKPATIIKTLLLLAFLAGIAYGGYRIFGPKPPRYLAFPATAEDSAKELLTRICAGDPSHPAAYQLIADSARDPNADDIRGDFLQVFHNLNDYLTAEFGNQWIAQTKLAPDPQDPNLIVAHVALETLHIRTAQQTPPDKMQKYGPHVGILAIDEVPVSWAADLRKMAVIGDFIGGIAGRGALSNLQSVLGAGEANRHLPTFLKKMELLQVLRNHWAATWRSVIQSYPYREDPVVRARLTAITNNEQYDTPVRQAAQKVLDDKVTEEDKIAVGL